MFLLFHSWASYQGLKSDTIKTPEPPCFIPILFTISNLWSQTWCPSTDKWIKNWNIIQSQIRMKLYHFQETGGHHEAG
jgi:hypothetical protein